MTYIIRIESCNTSLWNIEYIAIYGTYSTRLNECESCTYMWCIYQSSICRYSHAHMCDAYIRFPYVTTWNIQYVLSHVIYHNEILRLSPYVMPIVHDSINVCHSHKYTLLYVMPTVHDSMKAWHAHIYDAYISFQYIATWNTHFTYFIYR